MSFGHLWGNTPGVQIIDRSPLGATARKSGNANVVLPSPPQLLPSREDSA